MESFSKNKEKKFSTVGFNGARRRILIFSTAYHPFVGGAEIAIKEITDRIEDFEFDLITARMNKEVSKEEIIGKVAVCRVGFGYKIDKFLIPFFGLILALKKHKEKNYDIIWSLMASQASIGASFFKMLKPKSKLLLTIQEGDEESHLKRYVGGNKFLYKVLIQPWHKLVFKKADLIQTISIDLKNRALKNKVKCPVKVVPNGVDIKNFTKKFSNEELNSLRDSLGKKEGDKFIITTSRLTLKNGIDDLIKSLVYLPENIKLLVAGVGEDEKDLKNLVFEKGLENRIQFLGFIDHKELPKYLKISDVFSRPSLSEGLGNSFLEAMVIEIPVVATPVGGIPDFLMDKETGLFCKIKDPKSIAEKVELLINDFELRKNIINKAYEMILEKYDWDIISKDMQDKVFEKLLS